MSGLTNSSRANLARNLLATLWIVALYFISSPYRGVRHDALLYFGQMQHHLTPAAFPGDLFFLADSQDKYSAFSTIFAPVLQALGLSSAEIVILLALHALLLVAIWQLTAGMANTTRWCALGFALVLPHFYSSHHRFAYGEPFLTARTLAEPFAVFALAALLRGRLAWAIASAALAALGHPLIALPVWLIGWCLLCAKDRRWYWAALALVPVIALAALGVAPFNGLAHRYDKTWFDFVFEANRFVFVSTWQQADWEQLALDGGLLLLCARDPSAPLGRLARATLVVTVGCLVASAIGVDLMHNVLLTQLQLWRATWVAHLVALLSLGPLLARLWQQGGKGRLAVFAMVLAGVTVSSTVHTAWVIELFGFGAVLIAESRIVVGTALIRIGIAACVVAAIVISGVVAVSDFDQIRQGADTGILIGRLDAIPTALPALVLAVALLGLWPLVRVGRLAVASSTAAVVALLVYGAAQWDQRSDWARYVEQNQGKLHPFQALIPIGANVYWEDNLLADWALLGRPSFFSTTQASGALFSRQTTTATIERRGAVTPLVVQSALCHAVAASGLTDTTDADCKPTAVAVSDVCHLTAVHPDFIVLPSAIDQPPIARWRYRPADASEAAEYFLYDCAKVH